MASSRKTGTNEDISTYGASGYDYSSLATWEEDTDINCVTGTTSPVLECYKGVYEDEVLMFGATTNATYYRMIRCAAGQSWIENNGGVPKDDGTCVCFKKSFSATTEGMIYAAEASDTIQDLYIHCTSTTGAGQAIALRITAASAKAIGCAVYGTSATIVMNAIRSLTNAVVANCLVVYSSHDGASTGGISGTGYYYNNTFMNCQRYTFNCRDGHTFVVKNCIMPQENAATGTITETTNTTSTPTFVDSANYDFHLRYDDTTAKRQGTSLAADGTYDFDDDADYHVRTQTFDIGCFQYHWGKHNQNEKRGRDQIKTVNGIDVELIRKVDGIEAR